LYLCCQGATSSRSRVKLGRLQPPTATRRTLRRSRAVEAARSPRIARRRRAPCGTGPRRG